MDRLNYAQRGFTLVELLIVISIISIFSGLMFVNFAGVRERARDAQRKSDLRQIRSALRLYYNDYQRYPASSSNRIAGCGDEGSEACSWGGSFSANGTMYMTLPVDPVNSGDFVYTYRYIDDNNFLLEANLESEGDASAAESQRRCGVADDDIVEGVYNSCPDY